MNDRPASLKSAPTENWLVKKFEEKSTQYPWQKSAVPKIMALEPRMLFDGAAAPTVESITTPASTSEATQSAATVESTNTTGASATDVTVASSNVPTATLATATELVATNSTDGSPITEGNSVIGTTETNPTISQDTRTDSQVTATTVESIPVAATDSIESDASLTTTATTIDSLPDSTLDARSKVDTSGEISINTGDAKYVSAATKSLTFEIHYANLAAGDLIQIQATTSVSQASAGQAYLVTASDVEKGAVQISASTADLGEDGEKDISATIYRVDGRIDTTNRLALILDTTAPDIQIEQSKTIDQIVSGDARLSGTAEAGAEIAIYGGMAKLGVTTADASGNWQYALTKSNLSVLGEAVTNKAITAIAIDAAGNQSTAMLAVSNDAAISSNEALELGKVISSVNTDLLKLASGQNFKSLLTTIFGGAGTDEATFDQRVTALQSKILETGFSIDIQLLTNDQLQSHIAAYAASSGDGQQKIYLNALWLESGLATSLVINGLMEEVGHAIDHFLNDGERRQGDVGELFSRTVEAGNITPEELATVTQENDHGTIVIDGASVAVEFASVTFVKVYLGTGATFYDTNTNSISIGSPIAGSSFKFISANPADTTFSGNNIAGQLTYTTSDGQSKIVNGVISRKASSGSTDQALYFYETTYLGGATSKGVAYLMVIPGQESGITGTSIGTNSAGVSSALNTLVTAENANAAPVITSGSGTNTSISIDENTTAVMTVTATDANAGDTKTFSISGGVDAAKFAINSATGVLTMISAPDYEIPTDAGKNNVYDVAVTVTDSKGATDTQNIAVTVRNVDDNVPIISSNGGGSTASVSVATGTAFVTKVIAGDGDVGDVLTYSISGGANASAFTINSSTGNLSFVSAPASTGSYQVIVRVDDVVSQFDTQTITVNVVSSDTTPPTLTITSSDGNLSAGEVTTVYFQFSEPVQNFTLASLTYAGGTLSNLVQSPTDPTIYTAQFTQSGSGTAPSISVGTSKYQDLAGNYNATTASLSMAYDVTAPTVGVDIAGTDIAYGETKTVTFTFSENIGTSFSISDISVLNGTVSGLLQNSSNPLVWTASLQATSASSGPTVSVIDKSYSDLAGNLGASGSDSATLAPPTIDLANTIASDTGISSSDNITSNRKPVLVGQTASSDATVSVTVKSGAATYVYSSVAVTLSGGIYVWSLDLSTATPTTGGPFPSGGLSEGYVALTVTGNTSQASASNSFLLDTTAPATPTVTSLATSSHTPTISGTAVVADTETLTVVVNGVTYTAGDGNLSYNTSLQTWSLVIPSSNTIGAGTFSVVATVSDLAGNNAVDVSTNELYINSAPVLSGNGTLTAVNEDVTSPSGVALSGLGITANDTADNGSIAGYAIVGNTANASTQGVWQYSTNSGTNWYAIGTVTDGSTALALSSATLLRFVPVANYYGTPTSLTIRALDNNYVAGFSATGASETRVSINTTTTGGTTSISSATATINTSVTAVNDAPVLTGGGTLVATLEDTASPSGAALSSLGITANDTLDSGSITGYAIVGNAANASTEGVWQYSTNSGTNWFAIGTVSDGSGALALSSSTLLRFLPATNFYGTPTSLSIRALDNSYASGFSSTASSETRVSINTSTTGGTTSISSATATIATSVTAVNDAPVLTGGGTLAATLEDTASPSGAALSSLGITANDTLDNGSIAGYAIVGNAANALTEGVWQYSTNSGTNWYAIGTVADGSTALALSSATLVRFVPVTNYYGTPTSLTIRALDNSYAGGYSATGSSETRTTINTSTTGGTTAISSATATIATTVTGVNDAPVLSAGGSLSAVLEDVTNPGGAALSSLGIVANDTLDSGSITGYAIVGNAANASTEGVWQYSTNGGTNWYAIGAVADGATALALSSSSLVRFVPVTNYNGTPPSLTFRALDNSYASGYSVTAASETRVMVNSANNGGTTSISSSTATITTSVTAVNDAPVLVSGGTLAAVLEDVLNPSGAALSSLGISANDILDGGTVTGYAIISNAANSTTEGIWQYSSNGGTNWYAIGTVSDGSTALALSNATLLRFVPVANYNGVPTSLTMRALDNTYISGFSSTGASENRVLVNTTTNGGTTAISTATGTIATSVTAQNDAPLATGTASLDPIANNTSSPVGETVSHLFGDAAIFSDSTDSVVGGSAANTFAGIAISSYTVDASKGAWQYQVNGAGSWIALSSATTTSAVTLSAADKIRFAPVLSYVGSATALSVNLIESGLSITSGATIDLTGATGGSSHISSGTVALTQSISAANLAPVLADTTLSMTVSEDAGVPVGAVGIQVSSLTGGITDPDAGALKGIAVVGSVETNGRWYYTLDSGVTWILLGTVSDTSALLLSDQANTRLYFAPSANFNGQVTSGLTIRAWDQSSGVAGTLVDASGNGGAFAFSSATDVVDVVVSAINDAPVASGAASLTAIAEDTLSPSGASVGTLFGSGANFSDATDAVTGGSSANTFTGVAISSYTEDVTKGVWEYQVGGVGSWTRLASSSTTAAVTLNAADLLRFVPAVNYNGSATSMRANLVEAGLALTSGGTIDLTGATGGATHISVATITLSETITAVNDVPVRTGGTLTAVSVAEDSTNGTAQSLGLTGLTYGSGGGSDESGQTLTYTITNIPSFITVYKADGTQVTTATTGLTAADMAGLTYKTVVNANGTGSITWTVTDNGTTNGVTDPKTLTETLSVTVTSVNDVPVRSGGTLTAVSVAEDSANSTVQSLGLTGLSYTNGGGSDESSQTLTYTITSIPSFITVYKADGTQVTTATTGLTAADVAGLTYKTVANANGTGSITWTVTDNGTTNGVADAKTLTETLSVTVTSVNDVPIRTGGTLTSITVSEDSANNTAQSLGLAGLSYANGGGSDESGQTLTYTITNIPSFITVYKADGTQVTTATTGLTAADMAGLTYKTVANASGTGSISWTVTDNGTTNGAADARTLTETISLTVLPVNDAPSGTNKTVTTMQNQSYTFGVGDFGFTDPSDNASPNSLLAVKITTLPGAGTLTLNGNAVSAGAFIAVADIISGKLVFMPATGVNGTAYASFSFQVQDNGGTVNGGIDLDPVAKSLTIDVAQIPTLALTSTSVSELSPYAYFTASLSSASTRDIQFTPTLVNGTATVGIDTGNTLEYYDGANWVSASTFTIVAGKRSISLRLAIYQDPDSGTIPETLVIKTGAVSGVDNTSGAEGVLTISEPASIIDPVITDVADKPNDPTPFDLLTSETLQVIKVTGQSRADFVDLFLKNADGTYTQISRSAYSTVEDPLNQGHYTLDFGANALGAGDYVVRLVVSGRNSGYSNTFTIDSTPGMYDITGLRQIVTLSGTQVIEGGVGGMDQNRYPTFWNGTNWIDADEQVIRFSFITSTANPVSSSETKTLASGSTLTLDTRTGLYVYTPATSSSIDTYIFYATDGNKGASLSLTFDAKDPLDRDGIPSTVESALANLVSGGTAGDLNGDGIPDQNQNAVTTLAWTTVDQFQAALNGTLNTVKPIISLIVMQSSSGSTVDASSQLTDVKVLTPTDPTIGGSKPANATWDPLQFTVEPLQSMGLLDADTSRTGTQIRIDVDISRSGIKAGEFNQYMKYVSASVIADYAAIGVTLTDLDGRNIAQAGWYDFTQRVAGGDGARFIVSNGLITTIELIVTDNRFGDNNPVIGKIYDPGVPVNSASQSGGGSSSSNSGSQSAQAQTNSPVSESTTAQASTQSSNELASLASRPDNNASLILDVVVTTAQPFDVDLDELLRKTKTSSTTYAGKDQFSRVTSVIAPPSIRLADTISPKAPGEQTADGQSKRSDSSTSLKNTLTPPDAVVGVGGKIEYQLPQGTFIGGQGSINMTATLKDGSPLPAWITFDGATGKMSATVPQSVTQPVEIKIQARDTKGEKAETIFKIKPSQDKVGFIGKQSLTAQIDRAIRLRA